MAHHTSCSLLKSSDFHSQYFCDVCKNMLNIDQGNWHNNQCFNCVFKVYALCHPCSAVHKIPIADTLLISFKDNQMNVIWIWRQSIPIILTNVGSPSYETTCTHYWRNWKMCFQYDGTSHKYYRSTKTLVDY